MFQSITLGSASADTTTYTLLNTSSGTDVSSSDNCLGSQAAIIGGMLNGNSGTATVQFVLRSTRAGSVIRRVVTVTLTATAIKDNPDGSTGSNCVVTSSPATVDLGGHDEIDPDTKAALAWYVGVSAYGTVTAGRIDIVTLRAI